MGLNTVQEIERAIGALTPQELEELYSWFDQNCPQPIDARLQSDLAAGRLDGAIQRAQLAEFNGELGRRLASLDRGETVDPAKARARLQRKSGERRKPRA
jgi:hypothetical protein